jgi:hypothetical protein
MSPALRKIIAGDIERLRTKARAGDKRAAAALVTLAQHCCRVVEEFEQEHHQLAVELARDSAIWPMMVGGNRASSRKQLEERVDALQIGEGRDDVHIVAPKKGARRVSSLLSTANRYVDRVEYLIRCTQRGDAPKAQKCLDQSQIDRARKLKGEPDQKLHEQLVLDVIRTCFCRGDFLHNPDLAKIGIKANDGYFKKGNLGINTRRAKRESGSVMQHASASTYESQEKGRSIAAAQKKQRGSIEQQLRTAFRYRHGLDSIGGK